MRSICFLTLLCMLGCADQSGTTSAAGPAGGKADVASDDWSDHIRDRSDVVGALGSEATVVEHSLDPEFLVYEVTASYGDHFSIHAEPASTGADPMIWLMTADYEILAKNDDDYSYDVSSKLYVHANTHTRFLVAVTDVYRRPATFRLWVEGTSVADPSDLSGFLALDAEAKLDVLYGEDRYDSDELLSDLQADLQPEFSREAISLRDDLEGDVRERALDEYFGMRDACREEGGFAPEVEALYKGGLIYAFEMICYEANEDLEWSYLKVFDANVELLGDDGGLGFGF